MPFFHTYLSYAQRQLTIPSRKLALPHFPCSAIVLIHQETNVERR